MSALYSSDSCIVVCCGWSVRFFFGVGNGWICCWDCCDCKKAFKGLKMELVKQLEGSGRSAMKEVKGKFLMWFVEKIKQMKVCKLQHC